MGMRGVSACEGPLKHWEVRAGIILSFDGSSFARGSALSPPWILVAIFVLG